MKGWLLACFAAVLIAAVFFNFGPDTTFFANDQALSFAVVDRALAGEIPLAGPPSHVGGRHLGPFYYWYLAWTQLVGGGLHGALVVGALFMALSVLVIGWSVGGVVGVLAAVLVAVSGYLDTLRIPWHPHILLPLSGVFLFCTAQLLRLDFRGFGWWCFWASVLGQTHSAAVPFVVGVSVVVAAFAVRQVRREGVAAVFKGRAGWVFFILSGVPLACYNLFYDANLFKLLSTHSDPVVGAGFRAAVVSFAQFLWMHLFGSGATSLEIWGLLGLFCFVAAMDRRLRLDLIQDVCINSRLVLAVGSGVVFTLLALSRFAPPIYDYYWSVLLPLPIMAVAAGAALVWRSGGTAVKWAGVSILVIFAVFGGRSVLRYADKPFVAQHTLGAAERVVSVMRDLGAETAPEEVQIMTRLYAHTMKNTYNFLLSPGRFSELEVSYKFKELRGVPSGPVAGTFVGGRRYVVFCPVPYSKDLKRMMAGFRARWQQVGVGVTEGAVVGDRCLVKLLKRRDVPG